MNWDYAGKLQKAQMDIVDLPGDLDYTLPEVERGGI
jgi:alpha-ketoglutaric semialdehyde dehydrogenase